MRKRHSVRTAVIVVAVSWTFVALFVGIASGIHKNYEEPSPVSASHYIFLTNNEPHRHVVLVLGGFRLQAGAILGRVPLAVAYVICCRRHVPPVVPVEPRLHHHQREGLVEGEVLLERAGMHKRATKDVIDGASRVGVQNTFRSTAAYLTLFFFPFLSYPVAYSVVVLPVTVVRWITFSDQQCGEKSSLPNAATFGAVFVFNCFGFVNVLLLLTTRRRLLLFDDPRNQKQVRLRLVAVGRWRTETRNHR